MYIIVYIIDDYIPDISFQYVQSFTMQQKRIVCVEWENVLDNTEYIIFCSQDTSCHARALNGSSNSSCLTINTFKSIEILLEIVGFCSQNYVVNATIPPCDINYHTEANTYIISVDNTFHQSITMKGNSDVFPIDLMKYCNERQ